MKNRDKVILGTSLGVAAITTLLFTTKTGKKIRKEMCKQSDEFLDAAKDKFCEKTKIKSFDDVANTLMNVAVNNKDSIAALISNLFSKKF